MSLFLAIYALEPSEERALTENADSLAPIGCVRRIVAIHAIHSEPSRVPGHLFTFDRIQMKTTSQQW